jgi:hypothetical protein
MEWVLYVENNVSLHKSCLVKIWFLRYCVSYGDPHIIQFESTRGNGRPSIDFHSYETGDHLVFSYNGLEVWETQVAQTFRWGDVASNHVAWVEINGRRVVEVKSPYDDVEVLYSDEALLRDIHSDSRDFWPTRIRPGTFDNMITFNNYTNVIVFLHPTSKLVTQCEKVFLFLF